MMVGFIDENRENYGVEPICKTLPIAPSTYHLHKAREENPDLEPQRTQRDMILKNEIQRIWDDNRKVYGAKKVWKALIKEERFKVADLHRGCRATGIPTVTNTTKGFEIHF